jgi:hypothetical protein
MGAGCLGLAVFDPLRWPTRLISLMWLAVRWKRSITTQQRLIWFIYASLMIILALLPEILTYINMGHLMDDHGFLDQSGSSKDYTSYVLVFPACLLHAHLFLMK